MYDLISHPCKMRIEFNRPKIRDMNQIYAFLDLIRGEMMKEISCQPPRGVWNQFWDPQSFHAFVESEAS